ncbi:MAG: molybdenum cofactor biosynthesis protein MoaA [Phycisphaeraceae bacterium]|nr:molybdenum cofactor biosynthesis protein MoaA [Phycisphaeraceae bacterium]
MKCATLTGIATGCSFKVQKNLLRFAFNGHKAVRSFEKRIKQNKPFFPAFLMLSVTNRCNLKCKGCWVEQTKPAQQLSRTQIQGIIDTAARYNSRFFGILGGEPLLHSDLYDVFEQNSKAFFLLFTNGTILDESNCNKLAKLGNVSPLISIEGLEDESRIRRGRDDTFMRSVRGLETLSKAGLFTGAAASINQRNFDELVSQDYLRFLEAKGARYIWYYVYRPSGAMPETQNALTEQQIIALRQFIVEQRTQSKIIIVDAYWDAKGHAVCPGDMGLSHHIAPNGAVEFCPVVQFTGQYINDDASNLESIFQDNPLLHQLRAFSSKDGRSCVYMQSPRELGRFLQTHNALDSSNRDAFAELQSYQSLPGHGTTGKEIPEKSWAYRLAKKYYFFGFGAYG